MITQEERDISVIQRMLKRCKEVDEAILYFDNSYETFTSDCIFLNATSFPILIIGELSTKLSDVFKERNETIPWNALRAMRDLIVNEFCEMNKDSIWQTATKDIPELKKFCESVIDSSDSNE